MKRTKIQTTMTALMLGALLTGCAGFGMPDDPEQGEAVAQLTERQTAYPDRVVEDGNPLLDGTIAGNVIKTYRADTAERQAVRETIQVNIGK